MTTRAEWQQLAEDRILDVQAHLAVGRWSAAYYLIGYAVECGLKACILVRLAAQPGVIYEDRNFLQNAWTHDIETLVRLADLMAVRDADALTNTALSANWQSARAWKEISRYEQKTQTQAQHLFEAVTNPNDGVMQWIRLHW